MANGNLVLLVIYGNYFEEGIEAPVYGNILGYNKDIENKMGLQPKNNDDEETTMKNTNHPLMLIKGNLVRKLPSHGRMSRRCPLIIL